MRTLISAENRRSSFIFNLQDIVKNGRLRRPLPDDSKSGESDGGSHEKEKEEVDGNPYLHFPQAYCKKLLHAIVGQAYPMQIPEVTYKDISIAAMDSNCLQLLKSQASKTLKDMKSKDPDACAMDAYNGPNLIQYAMNSDNSKWRADGVDLYFFAKLSRKETQKAEATRLEAQKVDEEDEDEDEDEDDEEEEDDEEDWESDIDTESDDECEGVINFQLSVTRHLSLAAKPYRELWFAS
eukprot:COSAG01_NODE_3562_length_5928_cov_183.820412_3_plen_238_part_00